MCVCKNLDGGKLLQKQLLLFLFLYSNSSKAV